MAEGDPTLQFYAANAATYAARVERGSTGVVDRFLRLLPGPSRVLELGSGSGQDARTMLERGHDVTPSDGSPELAAEAGKLLGRPVRVMLFDQLDDEAAFDGVYACASLLHAPRSSLTSILVRIHRALLPGGVFWASYKAGEAEGHDRFGRYYNYLDESSLRAYYAAAASWASLEIDAWDGSGYDKMPTRWLGVTARK
ncbi:MAG: class I SAM-dependent methyltransferase [Devosia sp.]|nr:class I SAM-dependent methyltransferase [Devosia sp.]